MNSVATRHRLRLWLRSERAFGLPAVARPAMLELSGDDLLAVPQEESADDHHADAAPDAGGERAAPVGSPPVAGATSSGPLFTGAVDETVGLTMPSPSAPAFDAPALSTEEKRSRLAAMDANEVTGCTRCRLCETRTKTVFGEGDADAPVFFIGEGPGETEDRTGRPFVGRAGELLDKMIGAMGFKREQVFIANVVKCRPPNNREPAPDEVATCTPYLVRQLEIVRPMVIVTLGRPATQYMLQTKQSMSRMRGNWQSWRGIKLMPTYHPAYVLRQYTPEIRAAVWGDLKKVMAAIRGDAPG